MHLHLGTVDYILLVIYFIFVIAIGAFLKRSMKGSTNFFLSGRSIPAWITGLAFLSANLGAQEVIGMAASGAKYGIMTSHFYWIGAIPAMVFLAIFMMPFYYGSKARSVPEYLKLRFDEKTRGFNAISFAVMTIFSSGISLYALAKLLQVLHVFDNLVVEMGFPVARAFDFSIVVSAIIVLIYILLGGLTSAIYNEVLQFFMIVFGFAPLVYLGMKDVGGWSALKAKLVTVATEQGFAPGTWTHSWQHIGAASQNPMGVEWFGLVMGLGFVLSFGYWCTDFLVVQRAMAANSMSAARRTPLIAAFPKMLFPFLVILPGMIAIALVANHHGGFDLPRNADGTYNYNMVIPVMLGHYFPPGMLGLGFTALMASFMSGMAGNVTAFNTVWTYDIYQSYIMPNRSDRHYLWMGRMATIFGIVVSIGAAYLANSFNNIMDMLQLVFAFINAPLFATFLLGMFWKRSTGHGAFWGLILGTLTAAIHHGLTLPKGASAGVHGGWLSDHAVQLNNGHGFFVTLQNGFLTIYSRIIDLLHLPILHQYTSDMAQNFWTAIFAWSACFILTILISLATRRNKTDEELRGLVYSLTPKLKDENVAWYKHPVTLGVIVLAATLVLNIIFA